MKKENSEKKVFDFVFCLKFYQCVFLFVEEKNVDVYEAKNDIRREKKGARCVIRSESC